MYFFRNFLRKQIVTDEEERFIAFSRVFLHTKECFRGYKNGPISETEILGFSKEERFCISDIFVGVGRYQFGWIQRIEIDLTNNYAQIGHIATDVKFTGIGLGKRLALAIGEYVREKYGVDEIHFCESSTNKAYPSFFIKVLGAKHTKVDGVEKWIWRLPKAIN